MKGLLIALLLALALMPSRAHASPLVLPAYSHMPPAWTGATIYGNNHRFVLTLGNDAQLPEGVGPYTLLLSVTSRRRPSIVALTYESKIAHLRVISRNRHYLWFSLYPHGSWTPGAALSWLITFPRR